VAAAPPRECGGIDVKSKRGPSIVNTPMTLWDKLLPDQPLNNENYGGPDYHRSLYELIVRTSGLEPPTKTFNLVLSDKVTIEEMASNPVQLRFLELIVRLIGAQRVIEIGAFIGLSAMTMARAMPAGGKLVTIEKFDHFADICRRNFAANGLSDRIEVMECDAFALIDGLPRGELFDLAFIDGNKERYAHYFEALEPRVRSGGLILVDDVLFHGDVLNAQPKTEKGEGVKAFMDLAARRNGYLRLALPICNGLMLMQKP
jgi:caffeoyl-CoA O-methyltransferase